MIRYNCSKCGRVVAEVFIERSSKPRSHPVTRIYSTSGVREVRYYLFTTRDIAYQHGCKCPFCGSPLSEAPRLIILRCKNSVYKWTV